MAKVFFFKKKNLICYQFICCKQLFWLLIIINPIIFICFEILGFNLLYVVLIDHFFWAGPALRYWIFSNFANLPILLGYYFYSLYHNCQFCSYLKNMGVLEPMFWTSTIDDLHSKVQVELVSAFWVFWHPALWTILAGKRPEICNCIFLAARRVSWPTLNIISSIILKELYDFNLFLSFCKVIWMNFGKKK